MAAPGPRSGPSGGRTAAILAAAIAAVVAVLHLLNLLAGAYAAVAERSLDEPGPRARQAAAIAATLAPWSSRHRALAGWAAAGRGDTAHAADAYAAALRRAAGDGLLWSEYALALARAGRFDAALLHATRQAQRLAPHSTAVQQALASIGLTFWTRGGPDLQREWLRSMRHALARDRAAFLMQALTRGRVLTFCNGPAASLGVHTWCVRLRQRLRECAVGPPEVEASCLTSP